MNTIKELNEKLAQQEAEKAQLADKIAQMRLEQEESNGYHTALRLAHTHLESRLKSSEQRRELTEKENDVHKRTVEALEKDNDDLRERIKQGAKEYTKLFEKNRLLRNQRFNNEISHDVDSSTNTSCRSRFSRNHNSTSDQGHESDSAIQDRLISRSARASNTDIDNTFLDALLGSSFYNTEWNMNNRMEKLKLDSQMSNSHIGSTQQTIIPATITQPKSQLCQSYDLSDDGLINSKNTCASQSQIQNQVFFQNILQKQMPKQNFPDQFAKNDIKVNKNNP